MYRKIRPLNLNSVPEIKVNDELPLLPFSSRVRDKPRLQTQMPQVPTIKRKLFSHKHFTVGIVHILKKERKEKAEQTESSTLPSLNKTQSLTHFAQLCIQRPREIIELGQIISRLPSNVDYLNKLLHFPRPKCYEGKKTLVLDLDETLAHSVKNPSQNFIKIKVTEEVSINIAIRPFALDLLKSASQDFEIIIFTASQYRYANAIINHLDPMKKYISQRLYREHCYEFFGNFIKDLRIIGDRDLKDVVLVDNCLVSFALQPDNGIPISTWTTDPNDTQLRLLIDYLRILKSARDVRSVNHTVFGLSSLIKNFQTGTLYQS